MHKAVRTAAIVVLIMVAGTLLFIRTEHTSLLDALYFTVTTVSTVGYGNVAPVTQGGRIVTIFLIILGVGAALYVFSSVMSFMVEGRLRQILGVRKMKKAIERMRKHFIICGYGELGKMVVRELEEAGANFVIVESDAQKAVDAGEKGYRVVEGDATHSETLSEAGLEHAGGLATTISDDAENLYIGITARSMCPDLPVVCRSSTDRVRVLFERAGIERTISTDEIGARRLVSSLLRPHIVDFMDELQKHEEGTPSLHAVRLKAGAPLIGQTIQGAQLRGDFDIVVLAIRREGSYVPNPGPQELLHAEDSLIMIGLPENVERLRGLVEVDREALQPRG